MKRASFSPEKLKHRMECTGIDKKMLAEQIDIAKDTIQRWLSGRFEPNLQHIRAMSDVLDCDESDLMDFWEE